MTTAAAHVRLTHNAESDLLGIWRRRRSQRGTEGRDGADALLEELVARIDSLATHPYLGPIVPEMEILGIAEWRQLSLRHFRVVYRVDQEADEIGITVAVIADSRRDFRTLLEERLLRRS